MRRGLQITVFILSLIPAWYGIRNAASGAAQFLPPEHVTAAMDSQFRFQSAWYFGLALILWWIIPQIEKQGALFRIIALAIFLGGLSRLYSYYTLGPPPGSGTTAMVLELALPLLVVWQARIADTQKEPVS